MSRSKSPTFRHRLEYCAYRAFESSLKLISLETTFKLGELMGRIVHRLSSRHRRQITRNLRFAFGQEKTREEIAHLTAEIFERTGANFLSSLKIPFLSDDEILAKLDFEGLEDMFEATKNHGVVLVSPHMGNWELLAQAVFLAGGEFQVGTHYRPLNNALINSVVERRRKRRGLQLFPKKTSTHRLISFVREGGAMGILADQRVGSRGASCLFFGRPTTCSPLPHLIAKRGKGLFVSLSCQTIGTARWKIVFRPIEEISAQACANSIEYDWRQSPSDVFWFEDRWRIRGPKPLAFLKKYRDIQETPRPLRAVNLSATAKKLPYPTRILAQEHQPLDFNESNDELRHHLFTIADQGATPVDVFVCPKSETTRVKRLSGKVLVVAIEEIEDSSTQASL